MPANLPVAAEPLTHVRNGVVEGCGVRLTTGHAAPRSSSLWLDLSLNVYRSGLALVQAIAYEIPASRYDAEARPARLPLQRAWIKPEKVSASTRLGENTESRDTLVYAITLDDAAQLFGAVAAGQPLLTGFRPWGRLRESVFGGAASLSDDGRAAVADCLRALVN